MSDDYIAFASSLTTQQRQYVEGYVDAQVAARVTPFLQASAELLENYTVLLAQIEAYNARLDGYEKKFIDDGKYTLTRGKIIEFMRQQGIT